MIRLGTALSILGASLLLASPALAVTVTNQDGKEHTLTVDRGAKEEQQTLAAGASAKFDCAERCEIRVTGMGYGRPGVSGDKLVIGKGGMILFPNEAASNKAAGAK